MTRTGKNAEAYAYAERNTTVNPSHCLQETREIFDIAAKYLTAKAAQNAGHLYAGTPPAYAVPVYFNTGSPDGHVAFHYADGRVQTVNGSHFTIYPSISAMCSAWHCTYLGWSDTLNGVKVYSAPAKPKPPQNGTVARVQAFLNKTFPAYSKLTVDNVLGSKTAAVLKTFQSRTGIPQTGKLDSATLRELGKFGFQG